MVRVKPNLTCCNYNNFCYIASFFEKNTVESLEQSIIYLFYYIFIKNNIL